MTALDWRSRVDAHQNWSILYLPLSAHEQSTPSFIFPICLSLSLSFCLHTNNKSSNLPFFIINLPFPLFSIRQLSYLFFYFRITNLLTCLSSLSAISPFFVNFPTLSSFYFRLSLYKSFNLLFFPRSRYTSSIFPLLFYFFFFYFSYLFLSLYE